MKKLILGIVLVLSACASRPATEGPGETLDIRVHNDLVPPVILTISLLPAGGGPERNLGQAWSNRSTDFRYNGVAPRGEYRLVARSSDNRAMASELMVLDGVEAIEWNLQSNLVTVTRTRND